MRINYLVFIIGVGLVTAGLLSRFLSMLGIEEVYFLNLLTIHGNKSSIILGVIFIIYSFPLSYINTILSPLTKTFHAFLYTRYGSYLASKRPGEISIYTYSFFLSLSSLIIFILFGKHTPFHWATTADIPLIIKLINPELLQNDFYTNSMLGSSRFFFSYIIVGFTKLGMDWLDALYLLKITLVIIKKPLLLMVMFSIWLHWKPFDLSIKENEIAKLILFLFCSGHLLFFDFLGSPFGWPPIQASNTIVPMSLSLIFGLIYNFVSFAEKNFKFTSPLFLFLSICIHPTVGLFHFIISVIFYIPLSINKKIISKLCIDFLIGIVPVISFYIFFKSNSSIDASIFINSYVYLRHPHHYLMSEVFSLASIFLFLLFIIPLYYSFKIKNKKLVVLSLLILMSTFLGPLMQFLGTEIWKFRLLAELGPSRFTSFASILWSLNMIIVGSFIYKASHKGEGRFMKDAEHFFSIQFIHHICDSLLIIFFNIFKFCQKILAKVGSRITFLSICFSLFGAFWITQKHPLDYYGTDARLLINWIDENSSEDSVFFTQEFDTALVRVYGNRAIFSDRAFPFNHDRIVEFTNRFLILKKSKDFRASDYACLRNHFKVDYLIAPSKVSFENFSPVFATSKWSIYDINLFTIRDSCDINQLIL
ncbi:hypothetical protein OAT24_02830 [Gammaproteobacteria bacterium]|nr:hypothetical protein [Gammaproteobacteria bacterium]